MKTHFKVGVALYGLSIGGLMVTSSAQAQGFLVGAYLFAADGSGNTTSTTYQYDTNSSNNTFALLVNGGGKSFSQALTLGNNAFTFAPGTSPVTLNNTGVLGLFFNTTNTPYNPSITARTPDLVIARPVNGAGFAFVPAAGTNLNNYRYSGTSSANGLSTFTLGADTVSISSFTVTSTPNGSFTLNLTGPAAPTTPEPGTVGLLAGLITSGVVFMRRRAVKK